jgi:hypothetical protein
MVMLRTLSEIGKSNARKGGMVLVDDKETRFINGLLYSVQMRGAFQLFV